MIFPRFDPDLHQVVLGIDPSTKTGAVVLQAGPGRVPAVVAAGKITFPALKGFPRIQALHDAVEGLVASHRPTLAVIEGYGFANKFSLVTLVEIGTAIRLALLRHGVPVLSMTPKSLKAWASGDGAASKVKMKSLVASRWGFVTKDDDQADAYALAAAGLGWAGAIDCNFKEKEIIGTLAFLHCISPSPNA